jgi:hypothetical protein
MSDDSLHQDADPVASAIVGAVPPPGASWQEQDGLLRDLWMQNKTPQQIGEVLGRSVPAIMTRAARLGLPRRSAPGRKPGAGSTRRFASLNEATPSQETRRVSPPVEARGDPYVAPAAQASLRICLMCLRKFESQGRHNRICSPCKGSSEYNQASALPDAHLPDS